MTTGRGSYPRLRGTVGGRRNALVDLRVARPGGQLVVTCVVDTGFTGELVLPDALVARLSLPRVRSTLVTLGDGSRVALDSHRAEVHWLSGPRSVLVYAATGPQALLGTSLLAAHRLTIDYPTRTVEIA